MIVAWMGKHLPTFFGLRVGSYVLLLFFKQCFSFPFVCLYYRICWNQDSKIVVKCSSDREQINHNLFVLNSNKVAFVMHESQQQQQQ